MVSTEYEFDVAVVGGGPAGTTLGCILRKYDPGLKVVILEKARFPREHVGESQLPGVSAILNEMGCWDKVELEGFPIKLGASLTWGRDDESWDFDFYPVEEFKDEERPARYEGQRRFTAFQVDRAIYDKILLDHAAQMGVDVRQETSVRKVVLGESDDIIALKLDDGQTIRAKYYVDASGAVGLFRRELGLKAQSPKELRNIAIYNYWENIEWAVRIGVGGTRVQVRSLPYGWIWFIPLGPTRASIGLICPAEYYKKCGRTAEELYYESIASHEQIARLTANASAQSEIRTVKDWSFATERLSGRNWFICGEAAGFADPILAAGLTLHQGSARELAYTILEAERGNIDRNWLGKAYSDKTRKNIHQHIQFAQFWYASNGCFTDLQKNCQLIAEEAGLQLSPQEAWRWLAQGGFANQTVNAAQFGSFDFAAAKRLVDKFGGGQTKYKFEKFNVFKMNLLGAHKTRMPQYEKGQVIQVTCYERAGRVLPVAGAYDNIMRVLKVTSDGQSIFKTLVRSLGAQSGKGALEQALSDHMNVLEAMLTDGWVTGRLNPKRPMMPAAIEGGRSIRSTQEGLAAMDDESEHGPDPSTTSEQ